MGLEAQRKDKERQEEEATEELKIYKAGDGKGLFSTWGGIVNFGGTGPEWYTEVAITIPKAIQCSLSSMMRKEEPLPRHQYIF